MANEEDFESLKKWLIKKGEENGHVYTNETSEEFNVRIQKLKERLSVEPGDKILVVTHSKVIKKLLKPMKIPEVTNAGLFHYI